MVMEFKHFQQPFICKNERIISNGAKFKIEVDLKESITERYPGEVYQGICRCVQQKNITRALVSTQCTCGFVDMSGRKL